MNFPPLFRSLHSSLFIAFHYLLSPFIAFYRLSLPPHLIVRPLSALPRFVLTLPHFVPASPRSLTMPPHSPASHLLPSCFITPFVSHIRLSRTIVCAPFFYSLCFTHSIVLRPLFYFFPLCFTLSHCLHPLRFIYSYCFAPVFYSPATSANPSPTPQKATFFSFFKEILQKALDKTKKSAILIAMITVNQEKSMQRNTTQRIAIMRNMQSRCDHPTAYDVYDAVKTELPHISLTTVYRLLNSLNREGLLRRIVVEGESDRFDADISGHSHAVCTLCGRIIDCPAVSGDDAPFEKLLEAYGFEASCCDMIFRGVCAGCRQKQ